MKLPKHLVLKGRTFWMSKTVPTSLRAKVGKTHLQMRLGTDAKAAMKALPKAILWADTQIQRARDEDAPPDVVDLALQYREGYLELAEGSPDDPAVGGVTGLITDEADQLERKHGYKYAKAFYNIATDKTMPVRALIKEWNATSSATEATKAKRTREIQRLAEWLAELKIIDLKGVTRKVAARRVQSLISEGLMPSTINISLTTYSAYWRYCEQSGVVTSNPWAGQRLKDSKTRPRRRPLTEPELQKLIQYATRSDLILDAVRTLALSGMRVSELADLTVSDILSPPQFDIKASKTAASIRQVPIHDDLQAMINRRVDGKSPEDQLFHELTRQNRATQLSNLGSQWFREAGLAQKVGGGRQSVVSLHSLRHWTATSLEEAGVSGSTSAFLLGHERTGMTFSVYARSGPGLEALTEAINKLTL